MSRSFAASACFRLCRSVSCVAIMARIDGKAHFTATSQGVNIFFAVAQYVWKMYIYFITSVILRGRKTSGVTTQLTALSPFKLELYAVFGLSPAFPSLTDALSRRQGRFLGSPCTKLRSYSGFSQLTVFCPVSL